MKTKGIFVGAIFAACVGIAQAGEIVIDSSNSYESAGLQWLDLKLTYNISWPEIERAIEGTNGVLGHSILPERNYQTDKNTVSLKGWRYATRAEWNAMIHEMIYARTGVEPNDGANYQYSRIDDSLYNLRPIIYRIGDTGFASRRTNARFEGDGEARGMLAEYGATVEERGVAFVSELARIPDSVMSDGGARHWDRDRLVGSYLVRDLSPPKIKQSNPQACGRPNVDRASEQGMYLWSNCDGSGTWFIRVTGGGHKGLVSYEGSLSDISNLVESSIEAADELTVTDDTLRYKMNVYNKGVDRVNFKAEATACLTPATGAPPLFVGSKKVAIGSASYRLATGEACDGVPRYACGEPSIDAVTEGGTYIWSDCDGSNNWHLRVAGGGTQSTEQVSGKLLVNSSSPIRGEVRNIKPVKLESKDQIDTSDGLGYVLNVWGAGIDGVDFQIEGDVCLDRADRLQPVFFGAAKRSARHHDIHLRSGLACDDAYNRYRDRDGDGLTDWDEWVLGTFPYKADTDEGGDNDRIEFERGSDPTDRWDDGSDADGDGLNDIAEANEGTDSNNPDTDGDGLSDGEEVIAFNLNPLVADSDSDGLSDYDEVRVTKTNPSYDDTDYDGLSDYEEIGPGGYGTDPRNADTDGGGVHDGDEIANGADPLEATDDPPYPGDA